MSRVPLGLDVKWLIFGSLIMGCSERPNVPKWFFGLADWYNNTVVTKYSLSGQSIVLGRHY